MPRQTNTNPREPRAFEYKAVRADGTLEVGEVAATAREELRARLTARGLFPVHLEPVHAVRAAANSVKPEPLARGLRLLGSIVAASVPMERALAVFADVAPTDWATAAITGVRESIREGDGLAVALNAASIGIPDFALAIIQASEANGALASGLERAADELESAARTRSAIRNALAYPLVLAVTGLVSAGVLVGVVLPRFNAIVSDLGQSLPVTARSLLYVAGVMRQAAIPVGVVILVVALAVRHLIVTDEHARMRWAAGLLRVPITGRLLFQTSAARVSATLGALLASRVPISSALEHAAAASGNAAIDARVTGARTRVLGGERLSVAFERTRALPAGALQLIKVGEASGDLAGMLSYAARLERELTSTEVARLVRLIEPTLILVFGVLVAVVAAAMLQAVYSVRPMP